MALKERTSYGSAAPPDEELVSALAARMRGRLVLPNDDTYDTARQVWNGMIDRRPAIIAQCAGVADVMASVHFATEHDLPIAVRGGGHNVAGTAVADGAYQIDLSAMKGIRIDSQARKAWVEPGVTWAELDLETQAFGLATTGGTVSGTGIAGYTLGGGFGWLMRRFGFACDNLTGADVVTADGQFVRANAAEHADLFWALRGGGGNFGVVTNFEFRLHEVGPALIAGPVFHPLAAARDVLRFYREIAPRMPDALTCHAALLTSPEGAQLAALIPAYVGPLSEGEAAVQQVRAYGSPVADLVGPIPYCALQSMFDDAFPSGRRNYWKSGFLRGLDDGAIELMVERFAQAPSPHAMVFIEQCGGAASRVSPGETAYPHRTAPYNLIILAAWSDPAQDDVHMRWARELWTALQPFVAGGVYVNYLSDQLLEGEDRVRSAYGPHYDKLVALKRKYDPSNVFRYNQNIRSA
jgi:FAD/FMN-containing dehydrogenase